MFEKSLLGEGESTRKPYSMVLSLLLQMLILGLLFVAPFVFTRALPLMQVKSVLAAPKPPAAVKVRQFNHAATAMPRVFRVQDVPIRVQPPLTTVAAREVEPAPSVDVGETGGMALEVGSGLIGSVMGTPPAPPPALIERRAADLIRLGGGVAEANLIRRVVPQYPLMARSLRVQGVVEFTATISKEGRVENLMLVRGHPLLVNAAKEAVLQWRYRPTMLNGEPVEVITDIMVNFTLSQ